MNRRERKRRSSDRVPHDRWLVSEVATHIVEVKENGIFDFPGGYADYLERCGDDHLDRDIVLKKAKEASAKEARKDTVPPKAAVDPKANGSWEDQKKRRNRLKFVRDKRDRITRELDVVETRLKSIRAGYEDPAFFQKTATAELHTLAIEEKSLAERTDALMLEWEALEKEAADLAAELGESA